MEGKGESLKQEVITEQGSVGPADKWEAVKEVEFAGNGSARDKFYERYYKSHPGEVHKAVQDFLDQKMSEEEEHHAEEMTRIAEEQTDGWTEEDSQKLRELEKRDFAKGEEEPAEDAEEAKEDIIEDYVEKPQEESAEETLARIFEETHQKPQNEKSDFGEYGETQFHVGESFDNVKEEIATTTPEGEELILKVEKSHPINPEKYLVYSVSDSEQEAIPREKLIEAFQAKAENATDAKKYFETVRLSNQIMHEYQDNPEMIAQLKAIENTKPYQKNRTNAELETAKKVIAKRSEDLVRAQEEYDKLNRGGLFKKLVNRMARKTAESRVQWTKKDIENAQNDIARLEAQLAQLNSSDEAKKETTNTQRIIVSGNLAGLHADDDRDGIAA